MFAVVAALAGLLARERTGAGLSFDVSMTDGLMSWMTTYLFAAANGFDEPGVPPREPGYGLFRTADGGVITLSVAHEDWFWRPLVQVLGMEDVVGLTASERRDRYSELRNRIAAVIATRTRDEWERVFDEVQVPTGPLLSVHEVVENAHTRARGMVVDVPASDGRPARRHIRQPLKAEGFSTVIERHAPALGQDTVEVLRQIGYEESEVDKLIEQGVVVANAG